ncbi:MAG: DUF4388 domain-containing protein [Polyangia bacterium]
MLLLHQPEGDSTGDELAAGGIEVVRASDLSDIDAALAESGADLCILWGRGDEDTELCAAVRSTPVGAVLPVLAVGGEGWAISDRETAIEAGADSFVDGTADPSAALAKARTLLGLGGGEVEETDVPVERALEAAKGLGAEGEPTAVRGDERETAAGEESVLEVIDRVERSLGSESEAPGESTPPPTEDLDSLDIEADLGRPATEAEGWAEESEPHRERDEEAASERGDDRDAGAEEERDVSEEVTVSFGDDEQETQRLTGAGFDAGRLEDERLWDLLARLLSEKRSGVLALRSDEVERRIHLDRGEPILASSSSREDRLVELLYREGRLTEEQYQQAVLTVGASGRRVGAVLVERGFIASRELFPLVRHHYETLIFDTFGWREGTWRFESGEELRRERILLDLSAGTLIVEGVRSRADPRDVDALMPPGAHPVARERGICPLEQISLSPEERQLLEICDGTLSTEGIALRLGMDGGELRALLLGLAALEWVGPGEVREGERTGTARRSGAARSAAGSSTRVERARVLDKKDQVEEGTYFAILEVAPAASGHETRKAYRRLRGLFAPERFAVEDLADLRTDAEVIRTILDEAYEILRDPARREAYRQALEEGPAA